MEFLEDDLGNKSMMRKVVWLLVITVIIWTTAELTTYIWLSILGKQFEIHESFLLAAFAIALGGKSVQKGIEMFQRKKEEPESTEG